MFYLSLRFIKLPNHETGEGSDWELYGHAVAPEETENIATTRTTKKLMHEGWKGLKYLV